MIHAGDASDNGLRDPARDVTPTGTLHCKNDGSNARAARRTPGSTPVEGTPAPQNARGIPLGAGPRATPGRSSEWPPASRTQGRHGPLPRPGSRPLPSPSFGSRSTPVPVAADDNDRAVPADAPDLPRSPDTDGSLANAATGTPPAHTPHGNTAIADATARTLARTP